MDVGEHQQIQDGFQWSARFSDIFVTALLGVVGWAFQRYFAFKVDVVKELRELRESDLANLRLELAAHSARQEVLWDEAHRRLQTLEEDR